ncbi:MAG TPA: hypothetical protein VGK73_28995 [Polyangiaceae bacterium]
MTRHPLVILCGLACATALGCSSGGTEQESLAAGTGGAATAGAAGQGGTGAGGPDSAGFAGNAGDGGAPAGGSSGSGDRPYANVVAVASSGSETSYRFDVSIESSDIDCTQFANWWEVLGEDGALLYRRILEHSHTDENGTSDADAPGNTFTRDGGPIAITADTVVIVRAHMSNLSGYNGRVMRGSPGAGFADAPDITPDFAAGVEDDAPQPTGCDF